MNQEQAGGETIRAGRAALGIELGSTRIKASLIVQDTTPLASGSHAWENQLRDGVFDPANSLLDDSIRGEILPANGVLLVRDAEQDHRRDAQPGNRFDLSWKPVDGPLVLSGHG